MIKYIITRVQCKFSDGSKMVLHYDENNAIGQNICDDINKFRDNFKKTIKALMKNTILSILLTYEEYDDRK